MSNFAAPLRTIQVSFRAGENDPLFRMRVDTDNVETGARVLSNMLIQGTGAVTRRPGTKFLAKLPERCRLIEFEFDANEKYICAFHSDGLEIYDKYGVLVESFSNRSSLTPWNDET